MSDTPNLGFVRHEPIPPSPPPVQQAGAVKWVRENLFSNWINSILTILSIYFVPKLFSRPLLGCGTGSGPQAACANAGKSCKAPVALVGQF